jgi:hypothetical protein
MLPVSATFSIAASPAVAARAGALHPGDVLQGDGIAAPGVVHYWGHAGG